MYAIRFAGHRVEVVPSMRLMMFVGQPHGRSWVDFCRLAKACGYTPKAVA